MQVLTLSPTLAIAIVPDTKPFIEDIIRDFANRDQLTVLHNATDMPWLVRVQTQTEYVYVAPDEAAGASVAEEAVGEEEVGDFEDGESMLLRFHNFRIFY